MRVRRIDTGFSSHGYVIELNGKFYDGECNWWTSRAFAKVYISPAAAQLIISDIRRMVN
jgi:hypothetical protein